MTDLRYTFNNPSSSFDFKNALHDWNIQRVTKFDEIFSNNDLTDCEKYELYVVCSSANISFILSDHSPNPVSHSSHSNSTHEYLRNSRSNTGTMHGQINRVCFEIISALGNVSHLGNVDVRLEPAMMLFGSLWRVSQVTKHLISCVVKTLLFGIPRS